MRGVTLIPTIQSQDCNYGKMYIEFLFDINSRIFTTT